MCLECPKRRLTSYVAAEEVAVVGEHPDARIGFRKPVAQRLRYAKLGFERESIGADVDQVLCVVLSGRSDNRQACPERGGRLALQELSRRQRGAAEQVHGEAHPKVAQPRPRNVPALLLDLPAEISM